MNSNCPVKNSNNYVLLDSAAMLQEYLYALEPLPQSRADGGPQMEGVETLLTSLTLREPMREIASLGDRQSLPTDRYRLPPIDIITSKPTGITPIHLFTPM
jgi:hypothetical protein